MGLVPRLSLRGMKNSTSQPVHLCFILSAEFSVATVSFYSGAFVIILF